MEFHGEVDRAGGMCERADGDEVDTCFCVGADGGEIDAAAGFEQCATASESHSFADFCRRHIVEQDDVSTGGEGFVELFQIVHLDLDCFPRRNCASEMDGFGDGVGRVSGQCCDVVVLDQNLVVQTGAMIGASAAGDGIFFERAEAGSCLASVENARSGSVDRLYKTGGECGDAGEVLEKVECDALGRE